ncbi:MAG: hypothetical protein CMK89_20130 [Pseudomonadales bacterium]|nr:hypothetical protein [Pseudomonadales bacterium]
MSNIKQKIENNLTLAISIIAIGSFVSGWGACLAVQQAAGLETVTKSDKLKLESANEYIKTLEDSTRNSIGLAQECTTDIFSGLKDILSNVGEMTKMMDECIAQKHELAMKINALEK